MLNKRIILASNYYYYYYSLIIISTFESGEITTQRELDREKLPSHRLLISVRDQGVPFRRGLTQVLVTLLDENDNRPKFYPSDSYSAVLRSPSLLKGGDWVAKVQAADDDEGLNGELFYSIVSGW